MHYELEQNDVSDLLELISNSTLAIGANQAARVAYLQSKLTNLQPAAVVSRVEFGVAHAALEEHVKRVKQLEELLEVQSRHIDAERSRADAANDALAKRIAPNKL